MASVNCVGFSPDGKRLAAGLDDGQMRVWDVVTRRVIAAPAGHSSWIYSIAYLPNGRLIASASTDTTLRLWDPQSGRALGTLRGHDSEIASMAFSSNGTLLVSGSNVTVKLWDVSTDSLQSLDQDATSMPSNDGRAVAIVTTMRAVRRIEGDRVAFSPDGRLVAVGGWHDLRFYDTATWSQVGQLLKLGVTGLVFSPDKQRLLIGSSNGSMHVFDLASGAMVKVFKAHSASIRTVALSPDGQTLVTAAGAPTLKLWNTRTWRQTLTLHVPSPSRAWFSPDGRTLYTRSLTGAGYMFRAPQSVDQSPAIRR